MVSLAAGGVAGGIEAAMTVKRADETHITRITDSLLQYPFEFAKTRVQLRNEAGTTAPRNPFLVVGQVFRNEGIRALYKGCSSLIIVRPSLLSSKSRDLSAERDKPCHTSSRMFFVDKI